MKIAIFGAGGVGGYFGGRLADAGHEVHFLARGAHLQAMRQRGLRITSALGDLQVLAPATDDPGDIGPCDWVFVAVKAYDTQVVADALGPLVGDGTAVLSLQNGVDNEEVLAGAVGHGSVLGGVAFIFASIDEPGAMVHHGGPARIVFGEMDGRSSPRADALLDALRDAQVDAELSAEIPVVLWNKLAFICAQAGMTAAGRLSAGQIRDVAEARACFRRISAEVCAVARAEGIALPDDAPDRHLALSEGLGREAYSSLHHDLVTGRRMELEALHGAVVRRAGLHRVAVPANEVVYALLKPWAEAADAAARGA